MTTLVDTPFGLDCDFALGFFFSPGRNFGSLCQA